MVEYESLILFSAVTRHTSEEAITLTELKGSEKHFYLNKYPFPPSAYVFLRENFVELVDHVNEQTLDRCR
jgi:hypothetical protein